MIGKVVKGDSFPALAAYLMKGGRGDVLHLRHLASSDPAEAAAEMQLAASVSRRCKRPVLHISVSYSPKESGPTDDDMRADAIDILRGIGLCDAQAVVVRHRDAHHPHMHLMINRIGRNGRAVSDSNSYARVEACLRQIENRRGLEVVNGRHAPSPVTGHRMKGHRKTCDPRQHRVPESVRETLLTARNWPELHGALARDGWRLEVTQKARRGPGAVLIGPDGQRAAAGKVDKGATLSRLQARLTPPKAAGQADHGHVHLDQRKGFRRPSHSTARAAGNAAVAVLVHAAKLGAAQTRLGSMNVLNRRNMGLGRSSSLSPGNRGFHGP